MALSVDGSRLYVADQDNGRIAVFDPTSLQLMGEIGKGLLSRPIDLAVGSEGQRLFVADEEQERVVVFDIARGKNAVERWFDTVGSPTAVAAHPSGLLFVAEERTGKIAVFDEQLNLSNRSDEIISPKDIVIDQDGNLFVADPVANKILHMDLAGKVTRTVDGQAYGMSRPADLALGDRLWVADAASGSVFPINPNPDGSVSRQEPADSPSESAVRTKSESKTALATAVLIQGDRMWVTDSVEDRVYRFHLSGP